MSNRSLPKNASLENLKKQSKSLLKSIKSGDAASLSRIKPFFSDISNLGLQDAQLVIARDYGFSSWRKMALHLQSPASADTLSGDQLANEFLQHVVLIYSETVRADPARFQQASNMLVAHPEILDENIYVACAAGDTKKVKAWLLTDKNLINQKGGYHHWEPLMYATYSRLPDADTFAVARTLIEQGANPNAYYMWGGQYRFTALTGVFGQGEGGPVRLPEHPQYEAFARFLLEAGANPNDSQSAYNRIFEDDNTYLKLLLEFGLTEHARNNWLLEVDGEYIEHPQSTLRYQLNHAISSGKLARVKLIVESGLSLDYQEDNRSPYQLASLAGHKEIADYLVEHGASSSPLAAVDQLKLALLSAERAKVEALLTSQAELIVQAFREYPNLIEKAVDINRPEAIKLMVEHGFNINHVSGRTALHQAAWHGNIGMIKLLLSLGADSRLRDHTAFSPPLGWALHNEQPGAVEFLQLQDMDIFGAAARGRKDLIENMLVNEPDLVHSTFSSIRPNKSKACDNDWMTPLAFAVACDQAEIVKLLLDHDSSVIGSAELRRSIHALAREHAKPEIQQLLGIKR